VARVTRVGDWLAGEHQRTSRLSLYNCSLGGIQFLFLKKFIHHLREISRAFGPGSQSIQIDSYPSPKPLQSYIDHHIAAYL
jgi:hypothetical protein